MAWVGVVTNAGQALLESYAQGGHTLNLVEATVGSGTVAEVNLRSQTALTSEKDTASIISAEAIQDGVKYKVQVGPASADVGAYTAHQIGLWAKLDSGAKTLLLLAQDADTGVSVPLASASPAFAFALFMALSVDNTGSLTVSIDESAYVTMGTMLSALAAKVDKDSVYNGLDKEASGFVLDARAGRTLDQDKLDKSKVYNGLDKTASGFALDARAGKVLDDHLDILDELALKAVSVGPGSTATIDAAHALAMPFASVLLYIDIVQSGSGTPSAGNPRPFVPQSEFSFGVAQPNAVPGLANETIEFETTEAFYGCVFDVVSRKVIRTHAHIASYNGESLPGKWWSSKDVYASGTSPSTGAEVVYEVATPTRESVSIPIFDDEANTIGSIIAGTGISTVAATYYSNSKLLHGSDVVNNLTSQETQKPGSANMLRELYNKINSNSLVEHQITRIGTYFTERAAFKARRVGNGVVIFSYVNITTAVSSGTQFADTGFSQAAGIYLFIEANGSKPTCVTCSGGKLSPTDSTLATGYYYVVGCALEPV